MEPGGALPESLNPYNALAVNMDEIARSACKPTGQSHHTVLDAEQHKSLPDPSLDVVVRGIRLYTVSSFYVTYDLASVSNSSMMIP